MPTNLPAECAELERQYKAAESPAEKAVYLEELISLIPKHKGTDKLRAGYRRRLSKLKSAAEIKKGTRTRDSAFHIDKEGAGQVALVGPPNVGKSALVVALTNASPQVAAFPHTTWTATPGMMLVENVQIQLIDTPPLTRDFVEPELMDLIKRSDLILLVLDLQADPVEQLEDTVALMRDHRIVPHHLRDRYPEQRGLAVIPFLVLVNKCDDESMDEDCDIFRQLLEDDWSLLPLSATTGRGLEQFKQTVFRRLEIMRVYSKTPGKDPDFTTPFVLKNGDTVTVFAGKVHKDFVDNLKTVRVWGHGVFDGQLVQRDHVLHDGDVVELQI